ncbi:PREDICTED: uncharacterized protein LOC105361723 [Ceratosolen solmsi marchali]|uniref:Uncharacterized protein LOC105361723 n=1 Tax=Ceratosolen solmsi marchali TaxID=326594 RepID=A0AAJ6YFT7_9HYME|nr:PREDICTED: uncharacterized protein LOC105361723 [Ceratosolen solmsi marchali]
MKKNKRQNKNLPLKQESWRKLHQMISQITSVAKADRIIVSATTPKLCSCSRGLCYCCLHIRFNFVQHKVCTNISYNPDEFEFTAKVMINDQLLYMRTISGKNPRPICIFVPRIPVIRACIQFYNIYFQGKNIHACINIVGKYQDITLFKVGMECLRFGFNGIALVKPEDGGGLHEVEFLLDNTNGEVNDNVDYDDYYNNNTDEDNIFNY